MHEGRLRSWEPENRSASKSVTCSLSAPQTEAWRLPGNAQGPRHLSGICSTSHCDDLHGGGTVSPGEKGERPLRPNSTQPHRIPSPPRPSGQGNSSAQENQTLPFCKSLYFQRNKLHHHLRLGFVCIFCSKARKPTRRGRNLLCLKKINITDKLPGRRH